MSRRLSPATIERRRRDGYTLTRAADFGNAHDRLAVLTALERAGRRDVHAIMRRMDDSERIETLRNLHDSCPFRLPFRGVGRRGVV